MQFHWPHPYSLFLNFSRFSMFLLLNHWLQANTENIWLCNVGHTHFRDHWSQYLYILQKVAAVQKGYCQNETVGLWQYRKRQETEFPGTTQARQEEARLKFKSCSPNMSVHKKPAENYLTTSTFILCFSWICLHFKKSMNS